jgi:hypothetical protein
VLPEDGVGGDAILTVVKEDDHSIGVHGLAGVELELLEVGKELLLDILGSAVLESLDLFLRSILLLEGGLNALHVTLEVGKVALLVEGGALETERADDVVDLDLCIIDFFFSLLSRSVGTDI